METSTSPPVDAGERAAEPGAELVKRGIADLGRGVESVEGLLVARARTRLRACGVEVPDHVVAQPDLLLYRRLVETHADGAHARYNALARRLVSFCSARERAARS